jgi:hypothetical protein
MLRYLSSINTPRSLLIDYTYVSLKVEAGTFWVNTRCNHHSQDISSVMKELVWFTIDRNSMQIRNAEIDRSLGGSGPLKLQQRFDEAQVVA